MIQCFSWSTYLRRRRVAIRYYERYQRWERTWPGSLFCSLRTSNARFAFRDYGGVGREKTELYHLGDVIRHAHIVAKVLERFSAGVFFVEQRMPKTVWFQEGMQDARHQLRIQLIRDADPLLNLRTFDGGIELTPPYEPFLHCFIDYPFLCGMDRLTLFGFAGGIPLIVGFDHHLAVEFATTSAKACRRLGTTLEEMGLKRRDDYPGVFCNPEQEDWD